MDQLQIMEKLKRDIQLRGLSKDTEKDYSAIIGRYQEYFQKPGIRKKEENDAAENAASGSVIVDSDISRKKFCKNWARLIQKIYNVDRWEAVNRITMSSTFTGCLKRLQAKHLCSFVRLRDVPENKQTLHRSRLPAAVPTVQAY